MEDGLFIWKGHSARSRTSRNDPRCFFCASLTRTFPREARAAAIHVPASILSGITECVAPPSLGTPVIVRVGLPAPSMIAPIFESMAHRSAISGSQAAFSITVVPGIDTAAISTFAVPVTVLPNLPPRYTCAPFILRASTQI